MKNDIYSSNFTERLFDGLSRSYDTVNYITSFGFSTRWRRQFLQHIPVSNNAEVIDLMTGIGEALAPLKDRLPDAKVVALDISAGMLDAGRSKHSNVTFVQQDILTAEAAKQYDVVISAFGLKFFNDDQLRLVAQQVAAYLKPGGSYSVIETSSPHSVLMRIMYKAHLKYVVPAVGYILSGGTKDFRMLWEYTRYYQHSRKAADFFRAAGLTAEEDSYFYGCATGVHGRKPA